MSKNPIISVRIFESSLSPGTWIASFDRVYNDTGAYRISRERAESLLLACCESKELRVEYSGLDTFAFIRPSVSTVEDITFSDLAAWDDAWRDERGEDIPPALQSPDNLTFEISTADTGPFEYWIIAAPSSAAAVFVWFTWLLNNERGNLIPESRVHLVGPARKNQKSIVHYSPD